MKRLLDARAARSTAIGASFALLLSAGIATPAVGQDLDLPGASVPAVAESLEGVDAALLLTPAEGSGVGEVPLREGAVGFSNSIIVGNIGVQMLTTIDGPTAPTEYDYDIPLDGGQSLQVTDAGAAIINADGSIALVAAGAWARDANGVAVATHYEVEGATLKQIVDHATIGRVAYPVVADPIFLAPFVLRCLAGLGLNAKQIAQIGSSGSPFAVLSAFGYAAFRCIIGR